jgi:hypothetical protein
VIAFKLAAEPDRSDRDIAAEVKVSDKTVAAVRRTVSATAEFPQLNPPTRRGQDGKRRPARQAAASDPTGEAQGRGQADRGGAIAAKDGSGWCECAAVGLQAK